MQNVELGVLAPLACLLEAGAPKPGNVSPGRHFGDTRFEDFVASAIAIGPVFACAGRQPLGSTIRGAVESTRRWTAANTNLGIVLLLAPLARAAALGTAALRDSLRSVLEQTTVDDAREAYAAIRIAAPGGLGRVDAEDVAGEPAVTLLCAMQLAADRDLIAREYATAFETTFIVGAPAVDRARRDGLSWDDAVVETFVTLLSTAPDTHIIRRSDAGVAADVSSRARAAMDAGGVRSERGRAALAALDAALRDASNRLNPGATADLTAAAVFVELLGGGWTRTGRELP